jgi:acetyl esterase/lipase
VDLSLAGFVDDGVAALADETRAVLAAAGTAGAGAPPPPDPRTAAGLAAARAALPFRPGPDDRIVLEEVAEAGGRAVPIRVVAPRSGGAPRGVVLEVHGGGFYLASAARSDLRNARLADAVGVVVVSVDYRLAPEHPWPAAPDDCETAARWLVEHAAARFGTERLAITGASAGANLAVVTLLRLRDAGLVAPFAGAVLQFGSYDLSGCTPSGRALEGQPFLDLYLAGVADRCHPDVSPVFGDLRGLPPALLVVGTDDLLFEDSLAMAARLAAAGVPVDLRTYPASPHGFTSLPTAMAEAALRRTERWLADRFCSLEG